MHVHSYIYVCVCVCVCVTTGQLCIANNKLARTQYVLCDLHKLLLNIKISATLLEALMYIETQVQLYKLFWKVEIVNISSYMYLRLLFRI